MIENFLKELEQLGYKQREISEKTGLSQCFISELRHGKKCSVDALIRFSNAFGVSCDFILGRKQEKALSPAEVLLLKTTNGDDRIARAALRSAQGEKTLIEMEGERGKGRKGSIAA